MMKCHKRLFLIKQFLKNVLTLYFDFFLNKFFKIWVRVQTFNSSPTSFCEWNSLSSNIIVHLSIIVVLVSIGAFYPAISFVLNGSSMFLSAANVSTLSLYLKLEFLFIKFQDFAKEIKKYLRETMLKMSNENLHLTAIYWQKWLRDKNLKMYQNLATSFFWHFIPS